MNPCSIPASSSSTLARGASALVVQEAFETIVCTAGSYASLLTPYARVTSAPSDGALTSTFFAPASRWARAALAEVKRPVASRTRSTPSSAHGSCAGSRSAVTVIHAAVDDEGVPFDGDRAPEPSCRAVEGEQPGERGGLRQVVDGDDLEVAVALQQGAQHIAADAAESVDGDASHEWCPFRSPPGSRAARGADSGGIATLQKDAAKRMAPRGSRLAASSGPGAGQPPGVKVRRYSLGVVPRMRWKCSRRFAPVPSPTSAAICSTLRCERSSSSRARSIRARITHCIGV